MTNLIFPYRPGETFKRADLHAFFGGSFQHGMTSANSGSDFLLFHDEESNHQFGYNLWQGFQVDGSFHYTGQGVKGNQKMTRSNLALMKSYEKMNPIHLIESKHGVCTYIGRFTLGSPTYFEKQAPDIEKRGTRKVFVFNLIPITMVVAKDNSDADFDTITGNDLPWVAPNFTPIQTSGAAEKSTVMELHENLLQAEFGNFLIKSGNPPLNHIFNFSNVKGGLKPDFWIPSLGFVVEAKPSSAREFTRLAIGQVLDYANLASLEGNPMSPAILLPDSPSVDLVRLIKLLGITLILKQDQDFIFLRPES
jgi:hypothetical protein